MKSFIEALKADKWYLPTINAMMIIFLAFAIYGTFVGFEEAISAFGGWAAAIFLALFSTFSKNSIASYNDASFRFHLYLFLILITAILILKAIFYPKKSTNP